MSMNYDGGNRVLPRYLAFIEERAKGGVALIVTGGMTVDTDLCGRNEARQLFILASEAKDGIKALIDVVHKYDTKIMLQFEHMGRNGSAASNNGQQPVAPSAIQENFPGSEKPRELTRAEIQELVGKYVAGAKLCYELGADGIELHGGHSHLLGQFADKRRNQRTDEYGGTFENRMRFITEIIREIHKIKPVDRILSVRMNGTDAVPGGLTVEEGTEIAVYLESLGVDMLSMTYSNMQNIDRTMETSFYEEGCRTYFVKPIKGKLYIPVVSVNNIKQASTAEQLLENDVCDYIGLGRALLADPEFPDKVKKRQTDYIRGCIGCMTCLETVNSESALQCAMNPFVGREYEYNNKTLRKDGNGRTVVVIGGGPGGMEAAIVMAKRGFDVKLYDKNPQLGGALILASKGKGKEKIAWAVDGMVHEMKALGIDLHLGKKLSDPQEIKNLNPYAVIVATGALPIRPSIPGLDRANVYLAHDILRDNIRFNDKRIAIIGSGMTGLETAEVLLDGDNKIVMYDLLDEIAKGSIFTVRDTVMNYLSGHKVEFKPNHKLLLVDENGACLQDVNTNKTIVDPADIVVLSLGVRPNRTLEESLRSVIDRVVTIGDCTPQGGRIFQATRDGMLKVWTL
jgi:2,4-dienoyl-CoA reductase-like NADH-dependent reductase (Old Yellow Enzyme family)/NADPH-dependent 2,4-dienoyl-CoA reductase/sulfur reductase-like enzyme